MSTVCESAVDQTVSYSRRAAPRKSRSKYAHILDMTDEKEREVARKVRYFELGGDYTAVEFRRAVSDGQRILWATVDTVPRWRTGGRYSLHWWNIDTARQAWHECRSLAAAQALLNSLTLH